MPFPEKVRRYHSRVQGNQCQQEVYTERRGWRLCSRTEHLEDDHIEPEAQMLADGLDPNNDSHGIIRCKTHHRGRGRREDGSYASWGEPEFSRHPDMFEAGEKYHEGDKQAYARAGKLHEERAKRGIRYWNTSEETDQHEIERVEDMEWKHFLLTGETRPKVKPKPVTKKKWYDLLG